jgi:hypothetical protein
MTRFLNVIFSASSASETILANPLGMPPPPPASQPAAPCLTTVNAHRSVSAALPAPPHPCHDLRAAAPIARDGGPSAACVRVRGVMVDVGGHRPLRCQQTPLARWKNTGRSGKPAQMWFYILGEPPAPTSPLDDRVPVTRQSSTSSFS